MGYKLNKYMMVRINLEICIWFRSIVERNDWLYELFGKQSLDDRLDSLESFVSFTNFSLHLDPPEVPVKFWVSTWAKPLIFLSVCWYSCEAMFRLG